MRRLLILMFCVVAQNVFSQQSPFVKFGKVTAANLETKLYAVDSNANAVVLSDRGHTKIVGNSNGWFSLHFTRHKVVHILTKGGYDEADVEVRLYKNDNRVEELESVKAITYNLEGGKLKETKLEKSAIYTDKVDKNWVIKKFTLPAVKEGCIVEFEYKVTSEFLRHIDPWNFQGASPRLWSEFTLSAPSFFTYTFLSHGYNPFFLKDNKDKVENFSVVVERKIGYSSNRETINFTAGVTDYRWVMKEVPGLKEETYTSTVQNHASRIQFQLASQAAPLEPHSFIEKWPDLTKELIESEFFGKLYENPEQWIPDEANVIVSSPLPARNKALKLYEYVRDNYTCTGNKGFYAGGNMKTVLKSKKGTVADLNLLLTGLLQYAALNVSPVIISTVGNGYAYQQYASLAQFNYVVVQVEVDEKKYYLDASNPLLGFGYLLPECYNGHARTVNQEATAIFLMPDALKEKKLTTLFVSNGKDGKLEGDMQQLPGYYESYYIRRKAKEKGRETFLQELVKEVNADAKLKHAQIDSLNRYEEPVALAAEFEMEFDKADILYINPLFGEGFKKNPFQSPKRYYPVEIPYQIDDTYILTMDVPEGYEVDELPKQLLAKMDEKGSAAFEYRVAQSGHVISLRMILRLTKTNFSIAEYESLRNFFSLVVSKQSEQIVFKKKKS